MTEGLFFEYARIPLQKRKKRHLTSSKIILATTTALLSIHGVADSRTAGAIHVHRTIHVVLPQNHLPILIIIPTPTLLRFAVIILFHRG